MVYYLKDTAVASRQQILWEQAMWQDLQDLGHGKDITVIHVTGHLPMASPENYEADRLVHVLWVER